MNNTILITFAIALVSPIAVIFAAKVLKELAVVAVKLPRLLVDSARQYFANIWGMIASYSVKKA